MVDFLTFDVIKILSFVGVLSDACNCYCLNEVWVKLDESENKQILCVHYYKYVSNILNVPQFACERIVYLHI